MEIANTILVYEEDGQVKQRFCPEAEARNYLDQAQLDMRGGCLFALDGVEAEFMLRISPDLRDKVEVAKAKLKVDTRLRDALDRHGVPRDRDLRVAIFKALEDFKQGV